MYHRASGTSTGKAREGVHLDLGEIDRPHRVPLLTKKGIKFDYGTQTGSATGKAPAGREDDVLEVWFAGYHEGEHFVLWLAYSEQQ